MKFLSIYNGLSLIYKFKDFKFWIYNSKAWRVPYGQRIADGGSKWRAGTSYTEVRRDELVWRWPWATELGMTVEAVWQCAKDKKEWRALAGEYVSDRVSHCHFCLSLCFFGPPSGALVVFTWRGVGCRYMMRLGYTVERAQLLKIKAQVSSIYGLRGVEGERHEYYYKCLNLNIYKF